ncbi:hypothetical protein CWM57_00620 [Klebsiella sp. G-Nf4]|nr:hypothetical protein CWM64_02445 [Klebsiella sp. I-Nf8]PJX71399.1 hypothetical protein CWM57_00620 [Klebsiella sp. G-Nf4]PJX76717.1 hypothetical protein CWM55_04540 [Klebsiella sp. G2-16S-Nf13]PKJ77340.1 hypothetical protein CWM65_07145 [Klebsiella sp. J-Nf11]
MVSSTAIITIRIFHCVQIAHKNKAGKAIYTDLIIIITCENMRAITDIYNRVICFYNEIRHP